MRDTALLRRKRCCYCGEMKRWSEFGVRTRWEDGSVRRVQALCRECDNERAKAYYYRTIEARRAYAREYQRQRDLEVRLGRNRLSLLPAEPLREFVSRELADGWSLKDVAKRASVFERSLGRVMREQEMVSLKFADQIVTRLGGVFELVYPLEDE